MSIYILFKTRSRNFSVILVRHTERILSAEARGFMFTRPRVINFLIGRPAKCLVSWVMATQKLSKLYPTARQILIICSPAWFLQRSSHLGNAFARCCGVISPITALITAPIYRTGFYSFPTAIETEIFWSVLGQFRDLHLHSCV